MRAAAGMISSTLKRISGENRSLINAGNEKPSHADRHGDGPHLSDETQQQRPVRLQVAALLGGGREAILEHAGQDYRLRITANGKLILTK